MKKALAILRGLALMGTGSVALVTSLLLAAVYLVPVDKSVLSGDGGPLVITAADGTPLRIVPGAGLASARATWVPLAEIPAPVVSAVIVSEDRRFFEHRGIDALAIARAAYLNARERKLGYGGSTLTMQLARMVVSPNGERSFGRKAKEAVLSLRLERAFSKTELLEHYLNRAYYGHGAYGFDAAARRYFGRPAAALSLGQSLYLAMIPRAPSAYDPLRHPDALLTRRSHVMALLAERGDLSAATVARIDAEAVTAELHAPPNLAPHFVDWILATLPPQILRAGGVVTTTLDLELQERLEHRTVEHVMALRDRGVDDAGVVVLEPRTGNVLAMVGAANYENSQINMATRRRHPGSALKPFVYALALEHGDTPASIARDVRGTTASYFVASDEQPERGPVRYREALAGSYNLAAVDVLDRVGVADLMTLLRRAKVGELTGLPQDYGLRLALGSTKVRLVDLAAAYGFLVLKGKVIPARGVVTTTNQRGGTDMAPASGSIDLVSPETAWLTLDMLSDPEARRAAFGDELPFDLPFRVAAKTGTARGFADTVSVAVTSEYIVATWVGARSGTPTRGVVAMEGAAPLARDTLLALAARHDLSLPAPPPSIETHEVCALSGHKPSAACSHRIREHFPSGRGPQTTCSWHQREGGRVRVVLPPPLDKWYARQSRRGGRLAVNRGAQNSEPP